MVPGLKRFATFTLLFDRGGVTARMPTADGTHKVAGAGRDGNGLYSCYADATVSGEAVTLSAVTYSHFSCAGLGSPLILNAGDRATVTAIYG